MPDAMWPEVTPKRRWGWTPQVVRYAAMSRRAAGIKSPWTHAVGSCVPETVKPGGGRPNWSL